MHRVPEAGEKIRIYNKINTYNIIKRNVSLNPVVTSIDMECENNGKTSTFYVVEASMGRPDNATWISLRDIELVSSLRTKKGIRSLSRR